MARWPVEDGLVLSNGANLCTLIGLTPKSTQELEEVGWERYLWRTGTGLEWDHGRRTMRVSVGKKTIEIFLWEHERERGVSPDFYRPRVLNFSRAARLAMAGLMILPEKMFVQAAEKGILVADCQYPDWKGMLLPGGRKFYLSSLEPLQMMNWEKKPIGVIAL